MEIISEKIFKLITVLIFFSFFGCGKSASKENIATGDKTQTITDEQNKSIIKQSTSVISFSYALAIATFIPISVSIMNQDTCTIQQGSDKYFNNCSLGGAKFSGSIKKSSQSDSTYLMNLTFYFEVQQGQWQEFIKWESEVNISFSSYVVNSANMKIGGKEWNLSKFSISITPQQEGSPPSYKVSFSKNTSTMKDDVSRELKATPSENFSIIIKFGEGGTFEIEASGEISFEGWCSPEFEQTVEKMTLKTNLKDVLNSILCPQEGEMKIGDKQIKFSGNNYELNSEKFSCESVSKISCSFI